MKNIKLFWDNGWCADYKRNGKWIPLHRACCKRKADACRIAKEELYESEVKRNVATGCIGERTV